MELRLAHKKGDTFEKTVITIEATEINGVTQNPPIPVDLTNCTARCEFRVDSPTGDVIYTATEDDDIDIYEPTLGTFELLHNVVIDWTPGIYYFDIQFTFPTGIIDTMVSGSLEVIQDTTRPAI